MSYEEFVRQCLYNEANEYECNYIGDLNKVYHLLHGTYITPIKNIIVYLIVVREYLQIILNSIQSNNEKRNFLTTINIYTKRIYQDIVNQPNKRWLKEMAIEELQELVLHLNEIFCKNIH